MILFELFFCFLQIGLFSVGGGYVAIPLIQNQVVHLHGWLTEAAKRIKAIDPNHLVSVGSEGLVGIKIAGLPGAVVATLGCILPSLVIVSVLAYVYRKFRGLPVLQSVLSSLRPAVVALIGAAGLNMLLQIAFGGRNSIALPNAGWAEITLFAAAFFGLRKFKPSPILIMALCGAAGLVLGLLGIF